MWVQEQDWVLLVTGGLGESYDADPRRDAGKLIQDTLSHPAFPVLSLLLPLGLFMKYSPALGLGCTASDIKETGTSDRGMLQGRAWHSFGGQRRGGKVTSRRSKCPLPQTSPYPSSLLGFPTRLWRQPVCVLE